ncbi:MAG: hypothetical protein ACOYNL_09620 [Rickettsiales bacterium]
MAISLAKSQKAIVLLSIAWLVICLLAANNEADSVAFFIFISLPVTIYWAGVWIWGFGYIMRAIKAIVRAIFSPKVKAFAKSAIGLVVVVSVGATTATVVKNYRERPSTTKILKDLEKAHPAFGALRMRSPEDYQKIKSIVERGVIQKLSNAQIESETRQVMSDYAKKRISSVSDKEVIQFVSSDLRVAKDLSESAPDKCVSLILGKPTQELSKFIKPATFSASSEALNRVILASDTIVAPVSDKLEAQTMGAIELILTKQAMKHGLSEDDLGAIFEGKYPPKAACLFLIDTSEDMLALPEHLAAASLRLGSKID